MSQRLQFAAEDGRPLGRVGQLQGMRVTIGRLPGGFWSNNRTVLTADAVGLPLPPGALDYGPANRPCGRFPEDVEEAEPPVCQDCI